VADYANYVCQPSRIADSTIREHLEHDAEATLKQMGKEHLIPHVKYFLNIPRFYIEPETQQVIDGFASWWEVTNGRKEEPVI